MDTREDVIQKTYTLLVMMERATGYSPGEQFYRSVVNALNEAPEPELPSLFQKIADIVTQSVDNAFAEAERIRRMIIRDEEREHRSREIDQVSGILNF